MHKDKNKRNNKGRRKWEENTERRGKIEEINTKNKIK
jgi:hypothetical protein